MISDRGKNGEQAACDFLSKKGYKIRERNYRVSGGEIDIIASDNGELVFIEVKSRNSTHYGYPEESVHFFKQKKMARAIRSYLHRFADDPPFRIDIISVIFTSQEVIHEICHIPNILFEIEI